MPRGVVSTAIDYEILYPYPRHLQNRRISVLRVQAPHPRYQVGSGSHNEKCEQPFACDH
jgi:hypothetical protein